MNQIRPNEIPNQVTQFLNTMRLEAANSNNETVPSNVVDATADNGCDNAIPGPSDQPPFNATDESAAKSWVDQA